MVISLNVYRKKEKEEDFQIIYYNFKLDSLMNASLLNLLINNTESHKHT